MRQFFTFLSCTNPHISISTNSGIPILSVLVSSHLLQSRGCHHSHYQMRGWTSTKPESPQPGSSQGSQQPSCSYCLQSSSPHHAFGNHACQVSWMYFQNQAGSQIFGLDFQWLRSLNRPLLSCQRWKSCMKSFVKFYSEGRVSQKSWPMQFLGKSLP